MLNDFTNFCDIKIFKIFQKSTKPFDHNLLKKHFTDFPKWGGICDTGRRQSPINLSLKGAVKGIYGEKLEGDNYDKTITQASMVNTGHSSKFNVK